jgi:hypothetical protein
VNGPLDVISQSVDRNMPFEHDLFDLHSLDLDCANADQQQDTLGAEGMLQELESFDHPADPVEAMRFDHETKICA